MQAVEHIPVPGSFETTKKCAQNKITTIKHKPAHYNKLNVCHNSLVLAFTRSEIYHSTRIYVFVGRMYYIDTKLPTLSYFFNISSLVCLRATFFPVAGVPGTKGSIVMLPPPFCTDIFAVRWMKAEKYARRWAAERVTTTPSNSTMFYSSFSAKSGPNISSTWLTYAAKTMRW